MSGAARTSTRDIARAAIRAELAQVAFELFRRQGFDKVTFDGLAKAAGVSRSTFLRYFGTKEDAVLCARSLEKQNGWRPAIAQALTERTDPSRPATLGPLVRAAAAVDCLNIAVNHWTASDGSVDLDDLLDEAFAALATR
ncbi:TetR family transcriptional regulator [Streptomyces albicerus]|uniref:TetR family transcriptional regulator n=1 Tax=Streptomyces albicerus TaxID=2569859 RepID=UPI001CED3E21|nr:TetR family transcriptional regulator [Streptomyces albicerus]